MPDTNTYVSDWSSVPASRYQLAQEQERSYWASRDPKSLKVQAEKYFYRGYYKWTKHRGLYRHFAVESSMPDSFRIPVEVLEERTMLDIGCGPASHTLSLVHCAEVHALDPLAEFYKKIQPFGWEFFASVSSSPAEELPFETCSFDFVHCVNVLDHTRDADAILRDVWRVLRPGGQFLVRCDVRHRRGGGAAHPYKWSIETLEARVFQLFDPVIEVVVIDENGFPVAARERASFERLRWTCRLQRRSRPRDDLPRLASLGDTR